MYDPWGGPLSLRIPRDTPHGRQNLACEGLSCWHRGHVMPEPPSGRVGERSEPWAETNRPRLAWSRTRASAPVQLAGCKRSWLPHWESAIAGGQSRRCPYSRLGARAGVRFWVGIVPAPLHRRPPGRCTPKSKGRIHDGRARRGACDDDPARPGCAQAIQRAGGWKTQAMVERYAHLGPDHVRAAVERLAKLKSSGRTGTKTATHSSVGDS